MDSNRSKIRVGGNVDRISNLPDPILGNILSYMPTKHAIATSILSTRWKNIFPLDLPQINIDVDPKRNQVSTSFLDFVDKLLFTPTLLRRVDSFTLRCMSTDQFHPAKLKSWMHALVRLNVRQLRLNCCLEDPSVVFECFNGCTTLTRLEVKNELVSHEEGFPLHIVIDLNMPNLKTLEFSNIWFYDRIIYNDIDGEVSAFMPCPALEELSFTDCNLQHCAHFLISSLLLKTVSIKNSLPPRDSCVTINAPNLELLLLYNLVPQNYCIYPFKSLGSIDGGGGEPWYFESVRDLVYDCRKTTHLYLALSSIEYLPYENKQLPQFRYLTRLSVSSVRRQGWIVLACILNNAPNLEQLTFKKKFRKGDMGFADFERQVPSPPTCLELHLRRVEFKLFDFGEKEDAHKLLNYFVLNGKVLEDLVLN